MVNSRWTTRPGLDGHDAGAPTSPWTFGRSDEDAPHVTCHLFVQPAALSIVRSALPGNATGRLSLDYPALVRLVARELGSVVVVDPVILPDDTTELAKSLQLSGCVLILLTRLTPSAARAILHHAHLEAHALLLLPFDGPERIAQVLSIRQSQVLQLMFLRTIAPHFAQAADSLLPGVVAALHGHARVDSVKSLSAYCLTSSRTIERWFHHLGFEPSRFLMSARLVRARAALDSGWTATDAAQFGGYSRATSLWRAVHHAVELSPRGFRGLASVELITRLLAQSATAMRGQGIPRSPRAIA